MTLISAYLLDLITVLMDQQHLPTDVVQPVHDICVLCNNYLFCDPVQCDCGDRLCGDCYSSLKEKKQSKFLCPTCGEENQVDSCFRDKAVGYKLQNALLKCLNPGCSWEVPGKKYLDHVKSCQHGIVQCPNSKHGCEVQVARRSILNHIANKCQFKPLTCPWCKKEIVDKKSHEPSECEMIPERCPNGCGEKLPRREISKHMRTTCTHQIRECDYKDMGCMYKGTLKELTKHSKDYVAYHSQLLKIAIKEMKKNLEQQNLSLDHRTDTLESEVAKIRSELSTKLQPLTSAVERVETSVTQLQDGLSEVSLLLQTLQAASYDGVFYWKVPEVSRRRQEARTGKTVSLYSAPFYTSRHGYKLCLRLYMNGDGSGKGTHLSFFITIMRGEYDALLPWPFKQAVTLSLVDQNKQRDIVQSFRPESSSTSFQRPRNEMNIASGCPTFAPISVLDNTSYVKDDTMFLKCKINTTGLANE